jgi:thiamine-monophosphate kinase
MAGAPDPAVLTLAQLGENALVSRLTQNLPRGAEVLVGSGDDCAVIGKPRDKIWMLLKADCVIERIHFLAGDDPRRVGWKALCRAISDIAAMGGEPAHALITIAAVRTEKVARLEALYAGLRRAARRFHVSIVGGETARIEGPLFINVALTGTVRRDACVLRSGGKPGDALFVTGRLGGSRAGKHLDFIPRLEAARWLTANFRPHAMMDLSDGLAADLPRLAFASHCGFELCEERIPRTRGCTVAQALNDGEDYELLFAIPPRQAAPLAAAWRKHFPKLPLTRIGALNSKFKIQNSKLPRGFDHFA